MIVVGGFLHEVNCSPHDGIHKNAEAIFEPQHHENPKNAHNPIIPQHAVPGERLQEFKTYKSESKIGFDKGTLYPSGKDRPKCFNG